jgi:uncharacterized DUF497 family protein
VELEFDPTKNARNIRDRGISFERFADMDLATALWSMTRVPTMANVG